MAVSSRERRIAAVKADPALFRQALIIDADGEEKQYGPALDPWQRADFADLDPAWRAVAGQKVDAQLRRAWLERPRGHSKTTDIAASVAWALFSSPRRITGVCAAADGEQAGLIRDAISKLTQLNDWLAAAFDVQKTKIINTATESELRILTADAPSSYGLTPDFIVCDEVTHWAKRDLWDSLFSAAAKRKNCLLLVICNAGFEAEWQWPLREAVRTDPLWHFNSLDGPQASWITEDRLSEQRRLLPPLAFDRLWSNRWSAGSGDAIAEADISAACMLTAPPAEPEKGWMYVAGVDLGLKRDASAIVVIGRHIGFREESRPLPPDFASLPLLTRMAINSGELSEHDLTDSLAVISNHEEGTGRLRLSALRIFRPGASGGTVDVSSIEAALLDLHARFHLAAIGCDPWQARYLIERLQRASVPIEPVDFVGANLKSMCEATLSAFSEKLIELWPDPALLADLRNLRAVEKQYGVRLESPRKSGGEGTAHGDTATGLSIALHVARRAAWLPTQQTTGPLLCWP